MAAPPQFFSHSRPIIRLLRRHLPPIRKVKAEALVQTNKSLRNVVTRGDCECHARLARFFICASRARLLFPALEKFRKILENGGGGGVFWRGGCLVYARTVVIFWVL